eukprot:m.83155 g.83155  ORF g.83155 m.83155 type:complete len:248 (+) comp14756_c0_seq2:187-930(+)
MTPPTPNNKYSTFILCDVRFNVEDVVMVKGSEAQSAKDYIGKIKQIRTDDQGDVIVGVCWYYRPEELPSGRLPHHGRDEVIESDHMDDINVYTVNCKCRVLDLEEYMDWTNGTSGGGDGGVKGKGGPPTKKRAGGSSKGDAAAEAGSGGGNGGLAVRTFFSRSFYVSKKKKIREPLETYCICHKPQNPDQLMINCDQCLQWFHGRCMGLTPAKAKNMSGWTCPGCHPKAKGKGSASKRSRKRKGMAK